MVLDIFCYNFLKIKPMINSFIRCVDNRMACKMMYNKWDNDILKFSYRWRWLLRRCHVTMLHPCNKNRSVFGNVYISIHFWPTKGGKFLNWHTVYCKGSRLKNAPNTNFNEFYRKTWELALFICVFIPTGKYEIFVCKTY